MIGDPCETCGKTIKEDYRKDKQTRKIKPIRFCSRSCANSRSINGTIRYKDSNCNICGKPIKIKKNSIVTSCTNCKEKVENDKRQYRLEIQEQKIKEKQKEILKKGL